MTESPERRCAVSGERQIRDTLVRFVIAPDGAVVPDLAERLPGRGVWIGARRDLVQEAASRNLFARAARVPKARAEEDLQDRIETALAKRLMEFLGLACRAGNATTGFEKTRADLRKGPVGALIEARDGAAGGCSKLRSLQPDAPVIDCLDAAELGAAFGRVRVVHAVLGRGGTTTNALREAQRLEGFRLRIPDPIVCQHSQTGLSSRKAGPNTDERKH